MPISDVLLYADGAPSWPSRVAAALDLARRHDAHIVGVGVKAPLPQFYAVADGGSYAVIADFEATRARELHRAHEQFAEAMQANGYAESSEWREAEGDLVPALAAHSRYADLIIVSQGGPENDAGPALDFPGDLALASGRPVLAIPYIGARAPIGHKVLLGWNGSREAARAVADAMFLLQEAEEVCVLTISERGIRETAGNDLARYLARHGVRADVDTMAPGEVSAGDLMVNVAMDHGSDLLVMGCYGHSRLREAVFGGATHMLLRSMTIPVLMSH